MVGVIYILAKFLIWILKWVDKAKLNNISNQITIIIGIHDINSIQLNMIRFLNGYGVQCVPNS